jgi:HlyD family secretion protein
MDKLIDDKSKSDSSDLKKNADHKPKFIKYSRPLRIVSPSYVITVWVFIGITMSLFVLAFAVRLPVTVEGQGVLMGDSDVVGYAIRPENDGRLEEFYVTVGSEVKKGQEIGRVSNPKLENDIKTAELALSDLKDKLKKLTSIQQESLDQASKTIEQFQVESKIRDLLLSERLNRLDRVQAANEELISQGFLSKRGSDAVKTEREQVEDMTYISKRQLYEAEANFVEFKQKNRRELIETKLQINSQERILDGLNDRRKIEGVILSPYSGAISELLVDQYEIIGRDRRIATVTPENSVANGTNRVTKAILFVSSTQGKKLKKDMNARLLPMIFEEQEYGRIQGVVKNIRADVSDDDALVKLFKNQKLIRKLFENDAPYMVTIEVALDPDNISKLSWSSSKGPKRLIDPGTVISGSIVYDKPRFLYVLIPAVKRLKERLLDYGLFRMDHTAPAPNKAQT